MTNKATQGMTGRQGRPGELLPQGAVFSVGGENVKTCRRLLLIMVLVGLATTVKGEVDPASWLVRADQAAERANFTGTLSLLDGGVTQRTMKVKQGFDGRNTHQRWVSTSGGEECEIVRRANESAVVFPNRRVMIHGRQNPENLIPRIQRDIAQLKRYYQLETGGQEKVAGRPCQLVKATSRDNYRYGCELCVDTASGLPLRARMVTPSGEKIEKFAFTSVDVLESIQQFSPNSFWLATDTNGFETINLPYGSQPAPGQWRIENLPPGFVERLAVIRKLPLNPKPVYHIVLADALSRISVFVTRLPEDRQVKSRQFSRKALNGYITVRDGHQVTVIGGVPAETVRMIGDSVHRSADSMN